MVKGMEENSQVTNGNLAAIEDGYVSIKIEDTGEAYACRTKESLLEGMRRLGKRGIPIGCRSGGCSVCKVEIRDGEFEQIRPMSREYISNEDLENSRVLACCVRPKSDVSLGVIGKMHKNVCATPKL